MPLLARAIFARRDPEAGGLGNHANHGRFVVMRLGPRRAFTMRMTREHAVVGFLRRLPMIAAIGLGFASSVHCGGQTSTSNPDLTPDSGVPDSGGTDASSDGASNGDAHPAIQCDAGTSPVGRATAPACPATTSFDAGSVACTTFADCQDAGSSSFQACLADRCSIDQCFTDSDCPTGQACGCATELRGNARHTNRCLPSGCRVDSDCANGEKCSASYDPYCGSLSGYYCHSPADTCTTDATCCSPDTTVYNCAYAPELGHFACQARQGCGG